MTDTISFQVELCGRLADSEGPMVAIDLPAGRNSVADLKRALAALYPALGEEMVERRISACVDEAIVSDQHGIEPGQRIALFPPLSGG